MHVSFHFHFNVQKYFVEHQQLMELNVHLTEFAKT